MKNLIYLLSRLFFYGFAIFSVLVAICSILAIFEYYAVIDFSFLNIGNYENATLKFLTIQIPYTSLKVELIFGSLLLLIFASLLFYTYYFYVLKEFFKIFIKNTLFNTTTLSKMHTFYLLNCAFAIGFAIRGIFTYFVLDNLDSELILLICIHVFITIILYYYKDVIQKGFKIQEENDLTI